jgi:hypothetical protein
MLIPFGVAALAAAACARNDTDALRTSSTDRLQYAVLTVEPESLAVGSTLTIKGSGWNETDSVGVILYPDGVRFRDAFERKRYFLVGQLPVIAGGFEHTLRVPERLCLENGECMEVSPGSRYNVAATDAYPGGSSGKVQSFTVSRSAE